MKRYSSSNNILSSNTKLSSPSHYLKLQFSKESSRLPSKPVESLHPQKSTQNHQYDALKEKISNLGERIENIQKNYQILQKNRKRKIKEKKEESENNPPPFLKSANQSSKHSFQSSRAIAEKNKSFNTEFKRYSMKENHKKPVHRYDARKSLSPFSSSS